MSRTASAGRRMVLPG